MLTIIPTRPPVAEDSWSAALPHIIQLFVEGNDEQKGAAIRELQTMAHLASLYQDAVSIVAVVR